MKRIALKMMIFPVAAALLCFGMTLTASASVEEAEEGVIELFEDAADNDATDEVLEEGEEELDEIAPEMDDEEGEDDEYSAEEEEEEEAAEE